MMGVLGGGGWGVVVVGSSADVVVGGGGVDVWDEVGDEVGEGWGRRNNSKVGRMMVGW